MLPPGGLLVIAPCAGPPRARDPRRKPLQCAGGRNLHVSDPSPSGDAPSRTTSIISPALIRIAALPACTGIDGILLTIGGLLVLAASLVLPDLVTLRRVHRETLWGVPLFLVVHLAPAFAMPAHPWTRGCRV